MTATDFSIPRRMSAGAFFILLLQSLKEVSGFFVVGALSFVFNPRESISHEITRAAIAVGATLALTLIVAFSKYYFRKFHIEGDKLIFTHGFAFRQTTSIPLSRVHTLRTNRGLFYRIIGLRGITFDTLATDRQEVELILDEHDWQQLLHRIRMGEDFPGITDSSIPLPPPMVRNAQKVSTLSIIKGALCQNHLKGFAVLAAVMMALYDKISQVSEDASIRILDYIGSKAEGVLPSVWECVVFSAVIYLILLLLWTAKVALQYGDMNLWFADNRLTIESGLLSRLTSRTARGKVTVLTIKQNPLEKIARCSTVTLRQAENVTDTKEGGTIRVYGSNLGDTLLGWWLGANRDAATDIPVLSARSGRGLFTRKFIPHLIIATAVLSFFLFYESQFIIPAVILSSTYIVLMGLRAVMAWRHSGIELHETYVKINRGNIACIRDYIRYRDIESVTIRRSPLSSFTGCVSLQISTNAGATIVYSLTTSSATALRNLLLNKA